MRDYETMRVILSVAARAKDDAELCYFDFRPSEDDARLKQELERLAQDGLLKGDVQFAKDSFDRSSCNVNGLTVEGKEFYRLIENDEVWAIITGVLKEDVRLPEKRKSYRRGFTLHYTIDGKIHAVPRYFKEDVPDDLL